jgi:hypothetical protein
MLLIKNEAKKLHIEDFIEQTIIKEIDLKYNKYSKENVEMLLKEYSNLILYKYFIVKLKNENNVGKFLLPIFDFSESFIKDNLSDILYNLDDKNISSLISTYFYKLNKNAIYVISSYTPMKKSYLIDDILDVLNNIEEINVSKKSINLNHLIMLSKTNLFGNDSHLAFLELLNRFVKKYKKVLDIVINYSKSNNYNLRVESICVLSKKLKKQKILKIIIAMSKDKSKDVREEAVNVLKENLMMGDDYIE